jgi:anthranilate synthase component 1
LPDDYLKEAATGRFNITPVWEELVVDLETPISIFKKAVAGDYAYLLESVEGGEQLARYSFMGFDPLLVFQARGNAITIETGAAGGGGIITVDGVPLKRLREVMADLRVGPVPDEPRFCGGAVGYFGYDLVRHYEQLPETATDDLGLPDCCFIITRVVLIYDHVKHTLKIVALVPQNGDPAAAYSEALAVIGRVKRRLGGDIPAPQAGDGNFSTADSNPGTCGIVSNCTREEYMSGVRQAKEYIEAGDIFQVVLSRRLGMRLDADPLDVYRRLRSLNPSPYMYYLSCGSIRIVGSSPEMLVRVERGLVETRPIAGTRRRGGSQAEDDALARELRADPKECAEHLMLVDLGRNDLGRVSRYGSVNVPRLMEIERYSHVMHLVTVVQGKLAEGRDAFDALASCFPAGTLSGAPKIRAMEIIEELEPTRRGPYGGAIGYLSFNGNLDTCITIRTIVIKGGTAYVQAGAGIVADSDPEREYEECMRKAEVLLQAISDVRHQTSDIGHRTPDTGRWTPDAGHRTPDGRFRSRKSVRHSTGSKSTMIHDDS